MLYPLYSGTPLKWLPLGNEILSFIEGWPYLRGLKEYIWGSVKRPLERGCPHIMDGLYEEFPLQWNPRVKGEGVKNSVPHPLHTHTTYIDTHHYWNQQRQWADSHNTRW